MTPVAWGLAGLLVLGIWAGITYLLIGSIAVGTRPGHPRPERPGIGEDMGEAPEEDP